MRVLTFESCNQGNVHAFSQHEVHHTVYLVYLFLIFNCVNIFLKYRNLVKVIIFLDNKDISKGGKSQAMVEQILEHARKFQRVQKHTSRSFDPTIHSTHG